MPYTPDDLVRQWEDLKSIRSPFEPEWRSAAVACLPRQYGGWNVSGGALGGGGGIANNSNFIQGAADSRQFVPDTTAQRALPKYVALLGSLLTPQSQQWHTLSADDDNLNKIKAVRDYFAKVTDILFKMRYDPQAWFESAQFESYTSLGVYGTGVKFVAPRNDRTGIIYRSVSMKNVWLECNDEGVVDTAFRIVPNMTARNIRRAFPNVALPPSVETELSNSPTTAMQRQYEVLHAVVPNKEYDSNSLAKERRFKYLGFYILVSDRVFLGETEGYMSYPIVAARDYSEAGTAYGFSPASMALGSIRTANAIKKTLIKQGQKAVDPPILAFDDSAINGRIGMAPGAITWGGVDSQGRELIKPVQLGDYDVGTSLLQEEREAINDSFFVNLYEILTQEKEMTATEIMARTAERATILAPTMGRLQASDLGPLIQREIDVAAQLGLLPEMPPELQEAQGAYKIVYTSPLAKQQRANQVAAYTSAVSWAGQVAQLTGDASVMARFNFNSAMPDILDAQGVPSTWLNSDEQIENIMQEKQQQQQVDMAAKAAPAVAGMAKAAAVAQQAGGLGGGDDNTNANDAPPTS